VGPLFESALSEIPNAKYFESKQLLMDKLRKQPLSNSTVLVKASRGIGLETVVEVL